MEFAVIRLSGNRESVIEDILFSLAAYTPGENAVYGYQCEVKGPLKDLLCFLSEEENEIGSSSERQIFRIYAGAEEYNNEVLIVGSSLRGWGKVFFRKRTPENSILSMHISSTFPENTEWGLVGIAAPSWVLLFEENTDNPVKDILNEDLRIAYLPADEIFLDLVHPSISTEEFYLMLFLLMLENLPLRSS